MKFKYGKETERTVEVLCPLEKHLFGKIKANRNGASFGAKAASGEKLGLFTLRAQAAQAVAVWGYDHICREGQAT